MTDNLSERFGNLLDGTYDCVDRVVLNGFSPMLHSPGGFRTWWRELHDGSDEDLDNTHLMRMAGRFSRRVRAYGAANDIPVIDCKKGERKHEIAEEHLATHEIDAGLFMILIARAQAPVWDISHCADGRIRNIEKKHAFVNHYSFHIVDPEWGHITIKIPGHPPFGAQIILNGHEYVAAKARKDGVAFAKESNCFTDVTSATDLAMIADTLSRPEAIGRLTEVCERWIYSACLCFVLDSTERERSRFAYSYSVYQVEYSRNLLFRAGGQMETVFDSMVDRTRRRLDVGRVRTLFGAKTRPRKRRSRKPPRLAAAVETPTYDLTIFKVHFGNLTLKGYTKGERVLRFEAIVHNTRDLGCGRVIERFPEIIVKLQAMLERFCDTLDCIDASFIADGTLEDLPAPSQVGATRVGGVDLNKARLRGAVSAAVALAPCPDGFTVAAFTATVRSMTGWGEDSYTIRQGSYDLKKLRGKGLVAKIAKSHRYEVPLAGARTMVALLTLRDQVIKPVLAGVRSDSTAPAKPTNPASINQCYDSLRTGMNDLFDQLGIAA